MGGIAATSVITERPEPPAVLVVTTFDLDEYVFGALRAGASGFLMKDTEASTLIEAAHIVAAGHALVAPILTRRLIAEFTQQPRPVPDRRSDNLTPREKEALIGIARGLTNRELAQKLRVSENTAKTHVSRLLAKLHLASRAQAVVYAYETGLVAPAISLSERTQKGPDPFGSDPSRQVSELT